MGQVLHGSAATTHAVRAAIQRSQASLAQLSRRYGINPKTVAKWRKRETVDDAPMTAGDAGTYSAPGGYFTVKFIDDATYVVARASDDEITVPDIGERAAHNLDA